MNVTRFLLRALMAAALTVAAGGLREASAQQRAVSNPTPSANSIAYAKELLALKGGPNMFEKMVGGVIDTAKNNYLPTHPQLAGQLNEITTQLKTEYEPKKAELVTLVAIAYARHFTETELKELLAFYKTNLGKKVLEQESKAVEDGFKVAEDWTGLFSEQVMARFRAEMKKKGYDL